MPLKRLFFALLPPRAARKACRAIALDLHPRFGGRLVPEDNLHLTLAFLGSVPAARIAALCDAVALVRGSRFELVLDRVGCWPKSGVAWLAPSDVPAALLSLHEQLVLIAKQLDISVDARRFSPHVTLARHALCKAHTDPHPFQVDWPAPAFSLVESESGTTGVVYHELASWPLADT